MTIDNEQLTIMVSLRDEFQVISEGNTLTVNCQLSIVNFSRAILSNTFYKKNRCFLVFSVLE